MGVYNNDNGVLSPIAGRGNIDGVYKANGVLGAKNLILNTAVTTTTEQGVTYTVNSDKTVTISSGQTTSTYTNLSLGSVVLPEGDYILNGCPSGGGANTYRLRLVNGSTLLGIDSGDGYSFHADGNTNYTVTIGLSANGVSYTVPTDLLFKPMIRLASDTDSTYQPYVETNKQLTDNKVSYEINDILGAKNLIPRNLTKMKSANTNGTWNGNQYSYQGVTYTVNLDGTVDIVTESGGATANSYFRYVYFSDGIFKLDKGTYKYSGVPEGGGDSTYFSYVTDNHTEHRDTGDGCIFSVANDDTAFGVVIQVRSGAEFTTAKTFKLMVRVATDLDETFKPHAMTNKEATENLTPQYISLKANYDTTLINTTDSNVYALAYKTGRLVQLTGALKFKTVPSAVSNDILSGIPDAEAFYAPITKGTGEAVGMVYQRGGTYLRCNLDLAKIDTTSVYYYHVFYVSP